MGTEAAQRTANNNRKYSYLLMTAHLCDDLNQGALVAVMPFLVLHGGYSYAEVTALLLASNAASAVIQPFFGWLGDKKARPWLMALGIFLAGIGMVGVGVLPNYWLILASAMVSGIGVAMFHPEAGRLASLVAGQKKGTGMSIFAVGGKLGFTFGPLVTAAALTVWGLAGTIVFIFPAALASVVLLGFNRTFLELGTKEQAAVDAMAPADDWRGFAFVMGAVGTIASGWAGQKLGAKRLIIVSYAIVAVLVVIFAFNTSLVFALVLIMLLAVSEDISYPSAVALGQSFVPHHLGMASGISFGVMVCIGGVASPILGLVGDAAGLQVVMLLVAVIAIIGIIIAALIPVNMSATQR